MTDVKRVVVEHERMRLALERIVAAAHVGDLHELRHVALTQRGAIAWPVADPPNQEQRP